MKSASEVSGARPRVLVTGGAGYIGSHACKALSLSGYEPVTLDNLTQGHPDAVRWGPLVQGDVGDEGCIRTLLREHPVAAVMHFAGYAYVGESMRDPGKYFRNNVAGSLTLLDAVLQAGVRHFVFSSTCATYGDPKQLPINESHVMQPVNPYGASKLFVEHALRWYAQAHGLKFMALRYFNAAGADPEGEIGEDHDPETHLIPLAFRAATGAGPALQVFGTDYQTRDGTAIRDYVHVTDLADAHVRGLTYLLEGGDSVALNLGTGHGHTVLEVLAAVRRVTGKEVPYRETPRRAGDPPELVADASAARTVLGWQPQHSQLDEIVDSAWSWYGKRDSC